MPNCESCPYTRLSYYKKQGECTLLQRWNTDADPPCSPKGGAGRLKPKKILTRRSTIESASRGRKVRTGPKRGSN